MEDIILAFSLWHLELHNLLVRSTHAFGRPSGAILCITLLRHLGGVSDVSESFGSGRSFFTACNVL